MERDFYRGLEITHNLISTHTLTWSVTAAALMHDCGDIHFNSHAHVERDRTRQKLASLRRISTHTLTWSVTMTLQDAQNAGYISTHTLTWSVTIVQP